MISGPSHFRTTAWSVVIGAQEDDQGQKGECLARLCRAYWKPVYHYIRRRGLQHEEAKDMTQEYFTIFLEKDFVSTADRERGKFRTFVLVTVNRFLTKQITRKHHRDARQNITISSDNDGEEFILPELAVNETAEDEFNRRWALSIIEATLEKMRIECEDGNKLNYYKALEMFLENAANTRPLSYREMGQRLGMSETDITNYLFRGRNIFQKLLREEIRQSVSSESAIDEEIEALKQYLRT